MPACDQDGLFSVAGSWADLTGPAMTSGQARRAVAPSGDSARPRRTTAGITLASWRASHVTVSHAASYASDSRPGSDLERFPPAACQPRRSLAVSALAGRTSSGSCPSRPSAAVPPRAILHVESLVNNRQVSRRSVRPLQPLSRWDSADFHHGRKNSICREGESGLQVPIPLTPSAPHHPRHEAGPRRRPM